MKNRDVVMTFTLGLALSLSGCAARQNGSGAAGSGGSGAVHEIQSVQLNSDEFYTTVTIAGSSKPNYNVFRLTEPDRLIIDFVDASFSDAVSTQGLSNDLVTGVELTRLEDSVSTLARMTINLTRAADFQSEATDAGLTIKIARTLLGNDAVAEGGGATEEQPFGGEIETPPDPAPVIALAPAPAPKGATELTEIRFETATPDSVDVVIATNGTVSDFSESVLEDPTRIVIDLPGLTSGVATDRVSGDGGIISRVRIGKHDDKVRVVIEPSVQGTPSYRISPTEQGLSVSVTRIEAAPAPEAEPMPLAEVAPEPMAPPPPVETESEPAIAVAPSPKNKIELVEFNAQDGESQVQVKTAREPVIEELPGDSGTIRVRFKNTSVAAQWQREINTEKFGGAVRSVRVRPVNGDADLEIKVGSGAVASIDQTSGGVTVAFSGGSGKSRESELQPIADLNGSAPDSGSQVSAARTVKIPDDAGSAAGGRLYTGKRISIEFQRAELSHVLRLIAEVSRLNIVIANEVKGTVDVKLIDVPWDQALDIILQNNGLDKVQYGNILRIAPADKIRKEREVALANEEAAKQLEPLRLKLFNINYAEVADISARIKNLLSERGVVDTDARTNTIIVNDIQENLARVENLIRALDTRTPQVRIESRIVTANDTASRGFGIQWGPTLKFDSVSGKEFDVSFPKFLQVNDGVGLFPGPIAASNAPNFAVDAPLGGGGTGMLGFRLGTSSSLATLDLRIQYAELENRARVISRPSITVLDNKTASIIQGEKIPYLSSNSEGSSVSFVDVGVSINVTPAVTSDGGVRMRVSARSNEQSGQSVGENPILAINEATTEVLVQSGSTTVLGGVFKTAETRVQGMVPLFGRLPIIGWLFKNFSSGTRRAELLVFITPTIVVDTAPGLAKN